jgi:uncharacterized protein (DUF1501 family)
MTWTRRQFLTTTAAVGVSLPHFWQQVACAAPGDQPGAKETVLVVVQMSGGNDGLNTVIPFQDPAYTANRPTLTPPAAKVHKIVDGLVFHPALKGFSTLLEQGGLGFVQGVGYPNSSRSHFTSMDYWNRGILSDDEPFGWLGKTVEKFGPTGCAVHVGGGDLPIALRSPGSRASTVRSLREFQLRVGDGRNDAGRRAVIEQLAHARENDSDLLSFVKDTARETYATTARLNGLDPVYKTPTNYPASGLSNQLKLIAQLIVAGVRERVFYAEIGGFDTHSDQASAHTDLLTEVSDAIAAFTADMAHQGQGERVLLATFSEFGRRVKENGSQGTDHGAGSQMFLVGGKVKPGPHGAHPSLTDLDNGDLKFHTDFRRVYATVLDNWLGVPSTEILGERFEALPLLKA